jgi:hypothetical protein
MIDLDLLKQMDNMPAKVRLILIKKELTKLGIDYQIQNYGTGTNIWVDLGSGNNRIGIACHYDVFKNAGGANDNGAACLACLGLIEQYTSTNLTHPIRVFFFDEEEGGMLGSINYVKKYGVNDLAYLINLELIGIGTIPLFWPFEDKEFENPKLKNLLKYIETPVMFGETPMHFADHKPFKDAGLFAFTITNITIDDLDILDEFSNAIDMNLSDFELQTVLNKSAIFKTYHQPNDTYDTVDFESIEFTIDLLLKCIVL